MSRERLPRQLGSFPQISLSLNLQGSRRRSVLQLRFNWDPTGVKLVLVSSWTMAESGSKQIPVVGMEDQREITVLLAATVADKHWPLEKNI